MTNQTFRLTQEEVIGIVQAINMHINLYQTELRLYGSRIKLNLKGGDIDLLLVLPDEKLYQTILKKKIDILVEMKNNIGDQKIDFTLAVKDKIPDDPFLHLIYPDSVVLHHW